MADGTQARTLSQAPSSAMLSPRRLVVTTLGGLAALMAVIAIVSYYFKEPLMRVSTMFVEALGGFGVALGFFIPDAFTLPLPNDVATVLGLAGGLSFLEVTLWASGGSLVGGSVGYWIGRNLRKTRFVRRLFERRGGLVQATMDRYGVTAVAVAAITPLPYSIFCWAAGAGRISFRQFLLVSQLRWLRVAGYLYLIQLGLFSIG
jgi:membrane protein YqaA with SNARE-associated domain